MDEEKKIIEDKGEDEVLISIDEMTILIKNPEVTVRDEVEEDGRYMLFNAENELVLIINATGKFILDNCDGKKKLIQIIEKIKDEFTLKDDMDLINVVKEYATVLLKAKLIKPELSDFCG